MQIGVQLENIPLYSLAYVLNGVNQRIRLFREKNNPIIFVQHNDNDLVLNSPEWKLFLELDAKNKAVKAYKNLYNRWQRFGARVLLIVTATILISTFGSIMVYVMGVHSPQGFITMWFFQIIYVLTFLFLAQVPFFIVGDAGGWVNIAVLSIQLLSSGSTIPRELLSNFYQTVSNFLPATYAVDGIMKLITGGPSISYEIIMLCRILMVVIVITLILVALQWENKKEKSSNLTNV